MVEEGTYQKTLDPVETLLDCLERAWKKVCDTYDASAGLPDMQTMFENTDTTNPEQAAETVLINMLLEVMECICRFSPWYTKPPRSFGLTSVRDHLNNCSRWMLAPEAVQKWEDILQPMCEAIEKYRGLIQAVLLVDNLMARTTPNDLVVTACCSCVPPRSIKVRRSVMIKAEILCDECHQPYMM